MEDNSFVAGNFNDAEDEPKSAVQHKSRMRTLQEYEAAHGSKTELKKKRREREDGSKEFIRQIQQAIKDERTERHLKKKKDKPARPKDEDPDDIAVPVEHMREWQTYEENF